MLRTITNSFAVLTLAGVALAWVFPAMSVLSVLTIVRRVREGLNENNAGAAK